MKSLSKYTICKKVNNKTLLFNTLSLGLLELNEDYSEKLNLLLNDNADISDLSENLSKGNFLKSDINETDIMKYIHSSNKFQEKTLGLTIAPTLSCNFKCTYCYEEGVRYNRMSEITKTDLIKFVNSYRDSIDSLEITWYGGEPLLEIDTIQQLTEHFKNICLENNIKYSAVIISNGYLLNRDLAEKLISLDIKNVQITLDGPKRIHDSRRMLLNDTGTYDTIIDNISNIHDIININIRINIDNTNICLADEILDELKLRNLTKSVGVYVAQVDDVNNPHLTSCCSLTQDFGEYEVKFLNKALEYGFNVLRLPMVNLSGCGALMKNTYVIDPLGYLYKCWNTIGQVSESIGKLDDSQLVTTNLLKWMNYTPFNDECNECVVQPLCMGGCAYQKQKNGIHKCTASKYNVDDIVLMYYKEHQKKKCLCP